MFATKPATPSLEFDELARAFDRGALAALFGRDPDTVSRWRRERRVPHTVEMTVDRFWWVMHVACVKQSWTVDTARFFLLSIEPELGRRPAELVRESDDHTEWVVNVIINRDLPAGGSNPARGEAAGEEPARQSPFMKMLADPAEDSLRERRYRRPSVTGRVRPIGGAQEAVDPFLARHTVGASHAIRLGGAAVGV
jgi:hypothetical protein